MRAPTRGRPSAALPGSGDVLDLVGLGVEGRPRPGGRPGASEPRRRASSTSSQSASSAGVNSTTRLWVGAEGRQLGRRARHVDHRLLGPGQVAGDHHRRAPQDVGRARPWSASAGPTKPGKMPPPPGPLVRGSTASSTLTMRTDSPGRGPRDPDVGQGGRGEQGACLVGGDGERPALEARLTVEADLCDLVDQAFQVRCSRRLLAGGCLVHILPTTVPKAAAPRKGRNLRKADVCPRAEDQGEELRLEVSAADADEEARAATSPALLGHPVMRHEFPTGDLWLVRFERSGKERRVQSLFGPGAGHGVGPADGRVGPGGIGRRSRWSLLGRTSGRPTTRSSPGPSPPWPRTSGSGPS